MSRTDSFGDFDDPLEDRDPALPEGFVVDGKYEIKGLLGSGGSATVYEAQHATVGHRVAIKVVRSSHRQREESLARFRREAKICGAIRHPNVGQIYDVGELEDGTPFMVMELHEGRSLADVLHESIMPIAAIIEVARQLLAGLAAVHNAGAIHRDVKPDNAMIVRATSGDLVVKLVDFGISKVVRADIRERALTREDIIIGSPDYMAPEQLRGQEVDGRTDLYAVGVLLYEAVTGCLPFDAENLTDLMAAIVRDPVAPPTQLRTDCPPELERIILQAIARNPADRFQSAVDMSRELAHVQRAMRYATGSALVRLQEPMPPRDRTLTRARRLEALTGARAAAVDVAAAAAEPAKALRGRTRLVLAIAACAVLAAGLSLALASSRDAGPARSAAAVRAPAAPAPAAREPAEMPDESEPPVAAEPAVQLASPASGDPDTAVQPAAPERTDEVSSPPKRVRAHDRRASKGNAPAAAGGADDGPSVRELLDEAASAFVLGQMPRARSIYQQVLDRRPAQADAWRGLGLTASRMGQRKDAERAFERYLQLRPNAPDAARIREQLEKLR